MKYTYCCIRTCSLVLSASSAAAAAAAAAACFCCGCLCSVAAAPARFFLVLPTLLRKLWLCCTELTEKFRVQQKWEKYVGGDSKMCCCCCCCCFCCGAPTKEYPCPCTPWWLTTVGIVAPHYHQLLPAVQISLNLLVKESGIDRQFHPPIYCRQQ